MKPMILDNISHATTKYMHVIYKTIFHSEKERHLNCKSCNLLNSISIPEYKIFSNKSI